MVYSRSVFGDLLPLARFIVKLDKQMFIIVNILLGLYERGTHVEVEQS